MWRLALLVAVVLMAEWSLAGQAPGRSEQSPSSGAVYAAELEKWSAFAERLKKHPEGAETLRRQLPSAWSVIIQGEKFVVSTRWLDAALDSVEQRKQPAEAVGAQIQARLAAMRAEAAAVEQAAEGPLAPAGVSLDRILERREFRRGQRSAWLMRLEQRLLRWFADKLEMLFAPLRSYPRVSRTLLWAVLVGLVAAALVLLAQFLLRWQRPGLSPLSSEARLAETRWQELAREALEAASHEDYRQAVRLAYWAAVHRLEEMGTWKVDRARTHRETLCLLPKSSPQRGPLEALTTVFERIWYGGQPASSDHFQLVLQQLEALGCQFPSNPATANS